MRRQSSAPPGPVDTPPVGVVDAVPAVGKLPKIDEVTALAVTARFWDHYPDLQAQFSSTVAGLTSEVVAQLDRDADTSDIITNPREIRGIVASACHRALAIILLGMGSSIVEAREADATLAALQEDDMNILADPLAEPQQGI